MSVRDNTSVLVFTLRERVATLLAKTGAITLLHVNEPVNVIEANEKKKQEEELSTRYKSFKIE